MIHLDRASNAERQMARQSAQQVTTICEQLAIVLDPIQWQNDGMLASVNVNGIEIASLNDLSQRDKDSILRSIQLKLFEHAALEAIHAPSGLKAVMWSPVDVVQPQAFLSLWIITLETDERIPISESIQEGKRQYELFTLDTHDASQLTDLFGPLYEGVYKCGEDVTFQERERQHTGKILYILPPRKTTPRKISPSRGYHTIAGTAYTNEVAARYLVECGDGFPHLVHQSQVLQ